MLLTRLLLSLLLAAQTMQAHSVPQQSTVAVPQSTDRLGTPVGHPVLISHNVEQYMKHDGLHADGTTCGTHDDCASGKCERMCCGALFEMNAADGLCSRRKVTRPSSCVSYS